MISVLLMAQLAMARIDSPVTDRAEALGKEAIQRGNEPRGAASLIRLQSMINSVDDLNLLVEPYSILLSRNSTHPAVRTVARMFFAEVERARGRTVKSKEQIDELHFIQDFYAVGGFENEGKGGCDTDFGPEAATDVSASYPAHGRDIGWRTLGAHSTDGYVDLSVSLKPNTEAIAYALTFLQADSETKSVLSLGTSGGYRLWVNGVKVSSSDRYNIPHPDQQRVQVSLRKGMNRVLLKLCQEHGPLGFYLRATRAEGARAEVRATLLANVPPLEKGTSPQPQVQPTLSDAVLAQVKAKPNDAELRSDYATILQWQGTFDDKEHTSTVEADIAADKAPDNLWVQLHASQLQHDDTNRRRALITRALKVDPKSPWARIAQAELELDHDFPAVALQIADSLLKDFPQLVHAHLLRIRSLDALGDKPAALLAAETAFTSLNQVPKIANEAVAASRRLDRTDEAIARARMAIALRFDDGNMRRSLASMLTDLGKIDDAIDQYRKLIAMDPFDLNSVLRLAELLSANQRNSEASTLFAQAKTLAPDDAEVFEREGRSLLHSSNKDAALVALQKSLELRPQNPALKEMLRSLRGDDVSNANVHAVAIAPMIEGAKALTGEDAVYLADVTAVRVQVSGMSSKFSQLAVKLLSERGVEAFRQMPITYSPDRQEVRVIKARITKPDGSVVDSFGDQEQNINEPWTGMYYDARARVLTFPALAAGDVLELQWRIDDTAVDNLLSDYWGDVDLVQGVFTKKNYRFVVDMPKSRPLYWNASTLPKWIKSTKEEQGDRVVYRFSAEDVPRIIPEPQMPGWAEVATPLHMSTYAAWDDVGKFYWGLVRDQLTPNDELRKQVDTILKGVDRKDESKVIAAIYGFVVTNTRYVALEFGIHGYKPYRVDRILARRFGDCKDKASLIVSMLKVAGIDARMVLLRMRHLGTLDQSPASLSAFNHAIAYVPSQKLFLDGTAEFYGSHELPSADQVANVLVVNPEGNSQFFTTPEGKAEDNVTGLTMNITLKPDGSATAKGSLSASGQAAPEVRRTYQTVSTRQTTFEQQWAQSFAGISASDLTLSDPKSLETPSVLGFTVAIPRFAEAGGGALRFFPFGSGRAFTQALAPLATRTFDVMLPGVWTNRFHYTYTLPAGWSAGELPADVEETSPFGTLKISAKKVDATLSLEGEMVISKARVTAAEYAQFREWLQKIDQQFSKKLTVRAAGSQTAALVH